MPHAEHAITVNRPAKEVFDYLADGTHNAEWRSGVLEIKRTSATDGPGSTYRQVLSGPGGRRIDGDYRVTVFEPPRRLEFEVTAGPARPTGVFELTASGDEATVVRFALDLKPAGLMKLMTPMITKQMRTEVTQLDRLKSVLEGGQSSR
ncbi:MAG TPA: SRPBCC family protein [Streptosporangiaceae bacterium]